MAEKTGELDILELEQDAADERNTALQTRPDDAELTETNDDEATDETEQLREQIEETRRGMSETIDAIQEKLSFANISEQVQAQVSEQISGAVETAKDVFYDKAGEIVNQVGKGFKQIGETDLAKQVQRNPTALALIGAGVGALLVSLFVSGKSRKKKSNYRYDYDYQSDNNDNDEKYHVAKFEEERFDDVRYVDSSRRELTPKPQSVSSESVSSSSESKVSDTANSAYKTVSGAAGTAYETLGSVAGKTYEGVGSVAGKTYQGASTAANFAYEKAGDLGGQVKINYDHYIEENPLAVGAVAFAIGAAIGFAIPVTRKENEYLGEYRDAVVEKAQEAAQDAIGSVKQIAEDARNVIAEEVKSKTA